MGASPIGPPDSADDGTRLYATWFTSMSLNTLVDTSEGVDFTTVIEDGGGLSPTVRRYNPPELHWRRCFLEYYHWRNSCEPPLEFVAVWTPRMVKRSLVAAPVTRLEEMPP